MNYFLGVDAGGTKTIAVVMDEASKIIGEAIGGSGNYYNIGLKKVKQNVYQTIENALSKSLLKIDQISWCAIGIAACNTKKDYQGLFKTLTTDELAYLQKKITVVNDTIIGLYSGTLPPGIVVICGTGSNIYGINAHGEEALAGNWGYFLGDKGSGYIIGQKLFQAVVEAYDGIRNSTSLTEKLKNKIGAISSDHIYDWINDHRPTVRQVSDFAPVVIEAAEEGDEISKKIIDEAIREIGKALMAVVRRLKIESEYNRVVTVGGLFESKYFRGVFEGHVTALLKRVRVVKPLVSPAVGAAIMAKQEFEKISNHKS